MQEVRQWDAAHEEEHNPEEFIRDVLPKLQGVPLNVMMRATGLSRQYCSLIRRGARVSHLRHWEQLRAITMHGATATAM